jgi:hypothetical protein
MVSNGFLARVASRSVVVVSASLHGGGSANSWIRYRKPKDPAEQNRLGGAPGGMIRKSSKADHGFTGMTRDTNHVRTQKDQQPKINLTPNKT